MNSPLNFYREITYSANKYFDTVIYPNITIYPYSWITGKSEDTNQTPS